MEAGSLPMRPEKAGVPVGSMERLPALFTVRGEMDPWIERHAAVLKALLMRITDL